MLPTALGRRRFCGLAASVLLCTNCASAAGGGVLLARPGSGTNRGGSRSPGLHPLGIRTKRDSLLYVPKSPAQATGLVLYLHGAGGSEEQGPKRLGPLADKLGFLLLSPASEGRTWDAIRGGFGPDVPVIDEALKGVFTETAVDRVIVAGFSDGASYALGLGLRNTALFQAIAAFSPGFIAGSLPPKSEARLFVSHGTEDEILPIDSCSRQLVPRLKSEGHTVNYREFTGPHTVPPDIAEEGLRWALSTAE